jgi:tRNA (guanine10-N2)-methyltransferase
MDTYQGRRSPVEQTQLFESFSYFGFEGRIKMKDPEQTFCIFEDYEFKAKTPTRVYLGRWVAGSQRQAIWDYSLKRREYISTTSMDSELALLTANLSLAAPGKIFYDPFVGTGSFPIACSHFGAVSLGSDIDARMVRGKNGVDILSNFRQYGLLSRYLDSFISDLTHSPMRTGRFLDGIICDPPYGVREGLKVLGNRDGSNKEVILVDGEAIHLSVIFFRCFMYVLLNSSPGPDRKDTFLRNAPTASKQCLATSLSSQLPIL